jgi:hypothetical protein
MARVASPPTNEVHEAIESFCIRDAKSQALASRLEQVAAGERKAIPGAF